MTLHVRTEEIYEAATDQGQFERLSARFAEGLGARSGVIHWRDASQDEEEISYSGYFSASQMAVFGEHFANEDVWSGAIKAACTSNRTWNCGELVSPRAYEGSRIYNEWIRPMGDDTFHCLGGVLRMGAIVAEFGFHRGRGQAAFDAADVRALDGHLDHLRQLITIRHRIRAGARAQASLAAVQDALAYGIFTMTTDGRIVHHNQGAEAILQRGDGLVVRAGRLHAVSSLDEKALAAALERAGSSHAPAGALLIPRKGGGHYEMSLVSSWVGTRRQIDAFVHDRDCRDATLPGRLRTLFHLTATEAEVAVALEAMSVSEIAAVRGTTVETIRSQVKSVSGKLGCSRQSEIVAVICNLPKLAEGERPGQESHLQGTLESPRR